VGGCGQAASPDPGAARLLSPIFYSQQGAGACRQAPKQKGTRDAQPSNWRFMMKSALGDGDFLAVAVVMQESHSAVVCS
jgi:uncharacterized protein YfiM (DUF2279 family)